MTVGAPGVGRWFEDWQLCPATPGQHARPEDVDADARADWLDAPLGTVADMLRAAGRWSLDRPSLRLDAHDWWLRTRFELGEAELQRWGDLRLE
jgi:hypothetical protein